VAVPRRVALGGKREAGIGFDDGERCSQLVRRIGREGQLALPCLLDGRGHPPSDRQ